MDISRCEKCRTQDFCRFSASRSIDNRSVPLQATAFILEHSNLSPRRATSWNERNRQDRIAEVLWMANHNFDSFVWRESNAFAFSFLSRYDIIYDIHIYYFYYYMMCIRFKMYEKYGTCGLWSCRLVLCVTR